LLFPLATREDEMTTDRTGKTAAGLAMIVIMVTASWAQAADAPRTPTSGRRVIVSIHREKRKPCCS
jgi:hypothetical protein